MKKDKSILFDKVLSIVVKKKFPHIKEFYVNCDEDNRCEVGINITYKGLLETNQSELENEIKRLSRMILTDKGERVNRIFFYE
jgi:hypothetical protein